MTQKISLTGIKPTGTPHIGNYIGAIKPALESLNRDDIQPFYFIADYHALTVVRDKQELLDLTSQVAATWLALGLDPNKAIIYRQSRIKATYELLWILSCLAPKGLLNRAHAYKAIVADNELRNLEEVDIGVNMGLYNYPLLMAADILLFKATYVPVGEDQAQHIEIAREVGRKFNHLYGDVLVLPEYQITNKLNIIPGVDGRKMSKNYNNTIQLFCSPNLLRATILKIKTDSKEPYEPKDPSHCTLYNIYNHFATPEEIVSLNQRYQQGIGWGDIKNILYEKLNSCLADKRKLYEELVKDKKLINKILEEGECKARDVARKNIEIIRRTIGISE